jgi:hypothetical protein
MDGFVIASMALKFLDRCCNFHKKLPQEAYVFSQAEIDDILARAKTDKWKHIPMYIIPAKYDPIKDRTLITGSIRPAYSTGLVNENVE